VGEKSFGKASVQSVIPLSDGSSLRLTTAHYYTPKGNLIHEKGIDPDIAVAISREEMLQLFQQEEEIFGLSKEEQEKREKAKIPDRQIDVAMKLLRAEKIFRVPENPD
ncbi:MAG TPA: S41 family peptidase, partial [bacterium]|nr:S41 family peptidase [bacterium]